MLQSLLKLLRRVAPSAAPRRDPRQLLSELRERGFFAQFDPTEVDSATTKILTDGWGVIFDVANPRCVLADAEDLTEGGVADFLAELKPYLRRLGIDFTATDNCRDQGYTITLNGEERLIWRLAEFETEQSIWGLSTVRTFAVANELLEGASTEERLYAIYGGNELVAVFLTPPLYDLFCASPEFRQIDKPYIPVQTDDGFYGQPH